jgi:uroporphyrinogen-III synthase
VSSTTARKPRVALPETRQLDVLAGLLERRNVEVVRCPLVAILDSPDRGAVVDWIERFCARPMDLFVIFTGEGVRRLIGFAEGANVREEFVAALAKTPLITRGPKPVRALREIGIQPDHPAAAPTTDGVIETLGSLDIEGARVGVQLYGRDPNVKLIDYLAGRGVTPDCVAPYVYASESDDGAVAGLIGQLAEGEIDAIAFTSKAQVERLVAIAGRESFDGMKADGAETVRAALNRVVVAAVGPVVADELEALGVTVDAVPESDFFMKPMVTALLHKMGVPSSGSEPLGSEPGL